MEPVNVASPPSKWAPFNGASDFGKDMAIAFAALSCAVSSRSPSAPLSATSSAATAAAGSFFPLQPPTWKNQRPRGTPLSHQRSSPSSSSPPRRGLHGSAAKAADCVICLVDFTDGVPIRVLPTAATPSTWRASTRGRTHAARAPPAG
ncbi:hypothetical protein HPP92_028196 [Vanilla planifolia]|uniref:Uncharacterized protein n=1 Tax=Vanilla planifolia TaxID=51239 RepID=A0A835P8B1_VANPL|nr:hypothetical protein HPP92_028196 [Vanilla planifolia]